MRSKHCFKKAVAGILAGALVLSGAGLYGGNVKAAEKPEEEEVLLKEDLPEPYDREYEDSGSDGGVTWEIYTNYYTSDTGLMPLTELTATITGDLSYTPSEYRDWPWVAAWGNSISLATVSGTGLTNANAMFYECGNLIDIDISGLDTSNVTDMGHMFYGCDKLKELDLSNFKTSKVKDMSYMFADSYSIEELNLSKFKTQNVTNMENMFSNCTRLKKLNLSSFNTKKVVKMNSMFDSCKSLETLDISNFVTTGSLTEMNYMFRGCDVLTSVDLSGFNTSGVTELISVFENCESLTSLDLSSFDTAKVTILQDMCNGCESLTSLDLSSFDLTALEEKWFSVNNVLDNCYSLKVIKTPKVLNSKNNIALPLDEEENPIKYMNLSGEIREEEISDASDVYTRYEYPVESVSLSETTLKMTVNDTKKLSLIFTPKNASVKIVTWKSSNPKVVSVDAKGNLKALAKGSSTITVKTLDGGKTATCKVTVEEKKPDPKPEVKTVEMFRVYNPNSGEHFYTASVVEKDTLIKAGWNYEGFAWDAPEKSNTPVYRLYNANAGDHHYTVSEKEKNALIDAGWKYEGIGWYSDDDKKVPLYRLYNPNAVAGSHHYTVSESEKNDLVKAGWKDEGIAWFGR